MLAKEPLSQAGIASTLYIDVGPHYSYTHADSGHHREGFPAFAGKGRAKSFDKLPEEDRSFGPESTFGPEDRKNKNCITLPDCAVTYWGRANLFSISFHF